MKIDLYFNFWADLNPGISPWEAKGSKDPDTQSLPLQSAHRVLWTKQLPNGEVLELTPSRGTQLQWKDLRLSSDSIGNTYQTDRRLMPILLSEREHAEELFRWGSRIGAYLMFPGYRVDGKATINAARGMNPKIADRLDLTIESIRRHYLGLASPLAIVLERYSRFFKLFNDFDGYINFWHLNDLVDSHHHVRQVLPFDEFQRNAAPADAREFLRLKNATLEFLQARTERIRRVLETQ